MSVPRAGWRKMVVVAGAGSLALGAVTFSLMYDRPRESPTAPTPRAPTREELEAYEAAIAEPAKQGGFVIQEGLKNGLNQVAAGTPGPVPFQAVQWVSALEEVRKQFNAQAGLTTDTALEPATERFDSALQLYIRTAETIGAAAIAEPGPSRETLLTRAADTGQQADKTYDGASFLLQRLRRYRGLPPTARFPSPRSEQS